MRPKVFIIIFLIFYIAVISLSIKGPTKSRYCGKVTSMYRTDASHKVSSQAHVVFYSDSLKRKIDACVSNNTYANTIVGQSQCFELSKHDLKK